MSSVLSVVRNSVLDRSLIEGNTAGRPGFIIRVIREIRGFFAPGGLAILQRRSGRLRNFKERKRGMNC